MKDSLRHFFVYIVNNPHGIMPIGILDNIVNSKVGVQSFKGRFTEALLEYFDLEDESFLSIAEIPNIFEELDIEIKVKVDDTDYIITLSKTYFI